ncbi:hypothetical protein MG293_008573 [Ovis ammon polii]|uniref:Uncharacterized protein n=1 Tax=Ovis ammon polii TaxID=230172 RepID=A0AAD4U8P3_OVIAM|nr:hypothetical protein MG293_008573 [Ovis ammon polii]
MNLSLSKDTTEDLVNEFRLRSWNRTRSEAFAVRNPNYCHFPALMHTQRARQAPALHSRAESAVKHAYSLEILHSCGFLFQHQRTSVLNLRWQEIHILVLTCHLVVRNEHQDTGRFFSILLFLHG